LTAQTLKSIHVRVLQWYQKNHRTLPWRNTTVPYRILVSEIMLQQTQAVRAAIFYKKWLKKFPTVQALARSSKAEVLRAWSGLGYNNRAVRLHQLAKILADLKSRIPHHPEELEKLPGIGKYTSHAISCFAFHDNIPVVDVNIRRVLTRVTKKVHSASESRSDKEAWKLAKYFLPAGKAYLWNQALMDIGSQICTAKSPRCPNCPLSLVCRSAFSNALQRKFVLQKKAEPSYGGVPRRIIRGKILKALHNRPLTLHRLAEIIKGKRTKRMVRFLRQTVSQMESDGLVKMTGRGQHVYVAIAE
jgi:A/G-specific adenine glycosylase